MDLVHSNKVLFLFLFSSQKKFFPLSFLPLFLFKKRRRKEEGVEEENQHILAFLSFSSVSFPSPKGKEEEKKEEKSSFILFLFFLSSFSKKGEKKQRRRRKKKGKKERKRRRRENKRFCPFCAKTVYLVTPYILG